MHPYLEKLHCPEARISQAEVQDWSLFGEEHVGVAQELGQTAGFSLWFHLLGYAILVHVFEPQPLLVLLTPHEC